MDKFILGRNENRDSNKRDVFIIHLLNPVAIFQAHKAHVQVQGKAFKQFQFQNRKGFIEEWTLSVHFYSGIDENLNKLIDKAWRWYRSFLELNSNGKEN